jgi:transposase-like protein
MELRNPTTLISAIRYYSNEAVCVEFLSRLKWENGVKRCPKCDSTEVYGLRTRKVFKCRACKKQFSIKVGTIMQDSPLPITKWVPAIWMVVNCKNGISSCEMARALGIKQSSAWHMNHRIRKAIENGSMVKLSGEVETDSTYIGGLEKNRHAHKRGTQVQGGGGKAIVFGAVERKGSVQARVVDGLGKTDVENHVLSSVAIGSKLFTDEHPGYQNMAFAYEHKSVNHSKGQYVDGNAHTNTIENYWSLVKRMIKGTYVSVAPFHLDRYLQEQGYRFNMRKGNDSSRFIQAASQIFGKTLTYAELTGVDQQQ